MGSIQCYCFHLWQGLASKDTLLSWRWHILDIGCDGAIAVDIRTNTFKATQYHTRLITKNDIAEAPHQFDDETKTDAFLALRVTAIASYEFHYALPAWLGDGLNTRTFEILTQEHHKWRRLTGNLGRLDSSQVRTSQLWMSRQIEPTIMTGFAPAARSITLECYRVFCWLNNGINACAW